MIYFKIMSKTDTFKSLKSLNLRCFLPSLVLGMEHRALDMLGKLLNLTTESHLLTNHRYINFILLFLHWGWAWI